MANFIPLANGASLASYFVKNSILPVLRQLRSKFITDRQTDSKTDRQKNSLTPCTGVWWFFLSVKFASLAGGQADGLVLQLDTNCDVGKLGPT